MTSFDMDNDQFDLSNLPESAISGIQYCPIARFAHQALHASKTTQLALHNLRESCFINCANCPVSRSCELSEHFNLLVDQAVAEILEEWGW